MWFSDKVGRMIVWYVNYLLLEKQGGLEGGMWWVMCEESAYLGMLRGACTTKRSGINTGNRKASAFFFLGRDNTLTVSMDLYDACLVIAYACTAWSIL